MKKETKEKNETAIRGHSNWNICSDRMGTWKLTVLKRGYIFERDVLFQKQGGE